MLGREYHAEWWLPNDPTTTITGTLTYEFDAGLNLQLVGHTDLGVNAGTANLPVLLGRSHDGKDLTVIKLMQTRQEGDYSTHPDRVIKTSYAVSEAFVGAHLPNVADRSFRRIVARYTYLSEWSDVGRAASNEVDEAPISFRMQQHDGLDATSPADDVLVSISPLREKSHSQTPRLAAKSISTTAALVLESNQPIAFDRWQTHYLNRFQDFLLFCIGRPSAIESIETFIPNPENHSIIPVTILIAFSRFQFREESVQSNCGMLVHLSHIEQRLSEVISRWNSLYGPLDSVLQLYLAGQYSQNAFPFPELRVVSLVQALESYHRRRHDQPRLERRVWKDRVRRITELVPEEERDWLQSALSSSNQQSLNERLTGILNLTKPLSTELVADQPKFLKEVVDTRNYFTHYDKSREQKRLTGIELFRTLNTLTMLTEMVLLLELGFSANDAAERISDTTTFHIRNSIEIVDW